MVVVYYVIVLLLLATGGVNELDRVANDEGEKEDCKGKQKKWNMSILKMDSDKVCI